MVGSLRFLPWTAEETDACFIVKDHNGQALAYFYFENEPGRRTGANLLTRRGAAIATKHSPAAPLVAGPKPDANALVHGN